MTKTSKQAKEIELVPDAWARFERFVTDIAKAGPQHRASGKPKVKPRKSPGKRRNVKK